MIYRAIVLGEVITASSQEELDAELASRREP